MVASRVGVKDRHGLYSRIGWQMSGNGRRLLLIIYQGNPERSGIVVTKIPHTHHMWYIVTKR